MSIIKHVNLQTIVAHDFRYVSRKNKEERKCETNKGRKKEKNGGRKKGKKGDERNKEWKEGRKN